MASIQNNIPSSTASTPGPDFPGAYPSKLDTGAKDANPAASLEKAREYIPAQQDIKNTFSNVGETAKQYLPQSVASYFPSNSSSQKSEQGPVSSDASAPDLPQTHDSKAAAPRTVSHNSSSPLQPLQAGFAAMDTTSNFSGLSTEAQAGSSVGGPTPRDLTPKEASNDTAQFSPMTSDAPNRDIDSPHDAHSGSPQVPPKDLPKQSEPNEGEFDQPHAVTAPRVHPLASKGTKWNPEDNDVPEKALPRSPQSPPSNTTSTRAVTGHSSEYGLKPSTPPQSNVSTLSNGSKFSELPSSESSKSAQSNGSSGSEESGSPRRSKFMDKVRGEAKILSGKLGKNEEKVEEGRRMMGKV